MKNPGTPTRRGGTVRCAIYTRKSSEEGLGQEFNSLQAQREACEAFISSQRHEGWVCLVTTTAASPARQWIGRPGRGPSPISPRPILPRSSEIRNIRGASVFSVTEQFNTTTSMGRLTLNILLSF